MRYHKLTLGVILLILTLLSISPALAASSMTVTPVWRPGQQLTTLVSDSDYRYVDVELFASGNTQFWAINLACTLTPAVLEGYTVGDPGSNGIPMVTWGPEWGDSTEFVAVSTTSGQDFDYAAATGKLALRATRLGNVTPMGLNGANYTLLLATLRLRVKDLGMNYLAKPATIKCAPMDFLDRDGRVVAKGKQARTANLTVRTGYSISGQALLQGAKLHTGISVQCTNGATSNVYSATTDKTGKYTFGGASQLIREFGDYNCVFASPILSPQAEFLDAQIDLNLTTPQYTLLPVILNGGNVDVSAGSINDIDDTDLATFTSTWAPGSVPVAYNGLDVNGDKKINETDLAMFAGNYDPQDTLFNVDASHVLYGLATDQSGTFPNSRTFWGDPTAGPVQLFENPGRERDFWPSMSPDGSSVAYIRLISKGNVYTLYISPTARPRGRAITPRTFKDPALAPSWSPDGQRIAFVCSWLAQTSGYEFNEGNICIIDANGANLQTIAYSSKIYPPAWLDNNVLIYAGLDDHANANCQDSLCFYDLATQNAGPVSGSLLGDGNDVADMPGIGSFFTGGVETKYLFYRFDDGTSNSLIARTITYDGSSFTLGSAMTIATPGGGNDIDFYDVSPFMDVMYYESNVSGGVFRTIDTFYDVNFNANGAVDVTDWGEAVEHIVDGFVGNILSVSTLGGAGSSGAWNGALGVPTLFHAQRATFDWIP